MDVEWMGKKTEPQESLIGSLRLDLLESRSLAPVIPAIPILTGPWPLGKTICVREEDFQTHTKSHFKLQKANRTFGP